MIIENLDRGTILGDSIELVRSAMDKSKGLLGRDNLSDGQGMLFNGASSLHTFFMRFPIDIVYLDKDGKVLKFSTDVRPFRVVAAPLRAHYALELPGGAVRRSQTKVGDRLRFSEAVEDLESARALAS